MKPLDYKISFKGLGLGEHVFEYSIDKSFFDEFDGHDLEKSNVKIVLTLIKEERMLTLQFAMSGTVGLPCSRCLESLSFQIDKQEILFIKLGQEFREESENLLIIPETEHEIDVKSYIFEFITLAVPYKLVHPEDENGISQCSAEMLERLENFQEHEEMDPRWEKLREIKKKL